MAAPTQLAEHPDSFFKSLRPLFMFARLCGLLPVTGIFGPHHTSLRFSWFSLAHVYPLFLFISSAFNNVISFIVNVRSGIKMDNFGSSVFYSVCLLNAVFFLRLSPRLQSICAQFSDVDTALAVSCKGLSTALSRRIRFLLSVFVFLALLEYGFLTLLSLLGAQTLSPQNGRGFWHTFYHIRFGVESEYVPYSAPALLYVFTANLVCTLNWNFLDLFLICLSMQVSARLELIARRLERERHKKGVNSELMAALHIGYNKLSTLTHRLDTTLSHLILTSYISNLYHLSLQLLRSLQVKGDGYQMTYFYFSLSYLILRTLTVSFCAADIHEKSVLPRDLLFEQHEPCEASIRLQYQVMTDNISLTAAKFFTLNRKFIVSIIGTLVTYEVILLQMNALHYNAPEGRQPPAAE